MVGKSFFYSILSRFDKIYNTLLWLLLPRNKVIVINAWMKHRGTKIVRCNFGDDLNFFMIRILSGKNVINYNYSYLSKFHSKNYLCIGSIVDYMSNRNSDVWGSGAISDTRQMKELPMHVCAVRGPLTRNYLLGQGVDCPAIYGDPALLLPHIYPVKAKKKYKIGIIPHIVDLDVEIVKRFEKDHGDEIHIIDFKNYDDWRDVINQINSCEVIGSSSLHGLIISDAYSIPNVWLKLSDGILGDEFKYHDYFEGVGRSEPECIDFRNRSIDVDMIMASSESWKPLNFDTRRLIDSCPFLQHEARQRMYERIK